MAESADNAETAGTTETAEMGETGEITADALIVAMGTLTIIGVMVMTMALNGGRCIFEIWTVQRRMTRSGVCSIHSVL